MSNEKIETVINGTKLVRKRNTMSETQNYRVFRGTTRVGRAGPALWGPNPGGWFGAADYPKGCTPWGILPTIQTNTMESALEFVIDIRNKMEKEVAAKTCRTRLRHIALLLLMGLSFGAKAETNDGSDLLERCSEVLKLKDGARDVRFDDAAYCNGYLSGFVMSMLITKRLDNGERPVCLPKDGIPNHQVARIFVKTLRDNPQLLHESGAVLLYGSLMQAFPCK